MPAWLHPPVLCAAQASSLSLCALCLPRIYTTALYMACCTFCTFCTFWGGRVEAVVENKTWLSDRFKHHLLSFSISLSPLYLSFWEGIKYHIGWHVCWLLCEGRKRKSMTFPLSTFFSLWKENGRTFSIQQASYFPSLPHTSPHLYVSTWHFCMHFMTCFWALFFNEYLSKHLWLAGRHCNIYHHCQSINNGMYVYREKCFFVCIISTVALYSCTLAFKESRIKHGMHGW